MNDFRPLPPSRSLRPTFGISLRRLGIDLPAVLEDCDVSAGVTIGGSGEANAAVKVLVVVPADKAGDPFPSRREVREGLGRVAGAVLHCAEEHLGVGIVVADAESAERWDDSQRLQRRQRAGWAARSSGNFADRRAADASAEMVRTGRRTTSQALWTARLLKPPRRSARALFPAPLGSGVVLVPPDRLDFFLSASSSAASARASVFRSSSASSFLIRRLSSLTAAPPQKKNAGFGARPKPASFAGCGARI